VNIILVVVLGIVFLVSILIVKACHALPLIELKRRAKANPKAPDTAIYKMASYTGSLEVVMWTIGALSFGLLIIQASETGWWLVLALVLLGGWLAIAWHPKRGAGVYWRVAAILSGPIAKLVSATYPLTSRVDGWLGGIRSGKPHTGAYEKEDLLNILKNQAHQKGNRIPEADLRLAHGALTFGDKTVGSVMTPRRQLKVVSTRDPIGPQLMDELHTSGFSRFPVVEEPTKSALLKVVGVLYLRDLIDYPHTGKVGDIMKREVHYINEMQNLRGSLAVFLSTHNHLLVVVNNFEETVGVISLEDVLEQILGQKIVDEFDSYDDLRTVAAIEAKKEHQTHQEPKTPEQTEKTVVK